MMTPHPSHTHTLPKFPGSWGPVVFVFEPSYPSRTLFHRIIVAMMRFVTRQEKFPKKEKNKNIVIKEFWSSNFRLTENQVPLRNSAVEEH
jgi:hypothetical protein